MKVSSSFRYFPALNMLSRRKEMARRCGRSRSLGAQKLRAARMPRSLPMSDSRYSASGEDSLEPLNVPHLAAGTFMIQTTGTEVLLILQSARSLADKNTGAISERTVNQPIAVVSISPGTAKDLHILLGEAVAKHEESF